MKKTTFLLGLPRCGSLALSTMMNNEYCYAHHEGLDFCNVNLYDKKMTYDGTSSGILMHRAHKKEKNYFCCDISCSLRLIKLFCQANIAFGFSAHRNLQIVHVITSKTQSTESLIHTIDCAGDDIAHDIASKMIAASINALQSQVEDARYHLREAMVPILTIEKVGDRFTTKQVIEIAKFTGAWPDNDIIEQRKLIYLSDVSMSINKNHIDKGIATIYG